MNAYRAKLWGIIIVVALLLQGCGLKFWYNRLDWVVPWYVDDYVELTDAQESELEQLMVLKTRWHRMTELPEYVNFLTSIKQDIQQRSVVANYSKRRAQVREFYERILNEMTPELTSLMLTMSKEQFKSFISTLKENDQEWVEEREERTPEEALERRVENLSDNLKEWVGRLTKEQQELVKQWAGELTDTGELRLAYREQWRVALQQAFLMEQSPERQTRLKQLILDGQSLQPAELTQAYKNNGAVAERYLGLLADTLTEKQEKRLLGRIDNYIEDFNDLIADADQ